MPNPFSQELSRRRQGGEQQPRQEGQQAPETRQNPFSQELSQRGGPQQDTGVTGFFAEGLTRGVDMVPEMVGAGGQAISAGAEALGIPESVRNLGMDPETGEDVVGAVTQPFRTLGETVFGVEAPQDEPDTGLETVALGAGEALGALPTIVAGGAAAGGPRAAARAAQGLPSASTSGAAAQTATRTGGAAREAVRPFVTTPGRAAAAEGAAGAGFRGAEEAAEEAGQGPAGQLASGMAGGLAAAAGPGAAIRGAKWIPGVNLGLRAVRGAVFPFTEAGGRARASRRVQELSADPEAAAQNIEQGTIGNLSPARATGDENLLALEKEVLRADSRMAEDAKQRTAESVSNLRQAIEEPAGDAEVGDAQQFIGERLRYLTDLMGTRITQAQEQAGQRIRQLQPERRATESSRIAREELDKALSAAREQENAIWRAIPDDVNVPTTTTKQTFRDLTSNIPRPQRDDIPKEAERFLSGNTNDSFGDQETVREMHGLYSKLRETARKARSDGDFNTARIARETADAVLTDMRTQAGDDTDVGQMISDAIGFSSNLNQTFRQGSVGRILGYTREGGQQIAPEATLDVTVGRGGTQAAVSADEIRRAVGGQEEATDAAIQDYLRSRFQDFAASRGTFNPDKAQDFLRSNRELLDRFPQLRSQIEQAASAQRQATQQAARTQGRIDALQDPRRSRAAMFTSAPAEREFRQILNSRNPRETAQELVRQTSRDESEQALRGLKASALDYVINQAKTSQFDDLGQNILSGRRIQNLLNDPRTSGALNEVLTGAEVKRLGKIADELRTIETAETGQTPNIGSRVIKDVPNTVISFIGSTLAARAGAQAGAGTSGASLLTANFATQRLRQLLDKLTNDQAEQLLKDAVQDPTLLVSLLRDAGTNSRNARGIERRLMEWAEGAGVAAGSEEMNDTGAAAGEQNQRPRQ